MRMPLERDVPPQLAVNAEDPKDAPVSPRATVYSMPQ